MRTRAPRCHGPHRQNASVPLSANLSTSCSGSCSVEQVPSGLRAKRPAADRPGEAARRVGELPGAAGYLPGELRRPGEQAAVRVDMKRQALPDRADHVQGAAGEDQIVLANGTAVHDLDDRPTPLNTPLARTTLLTTVRVVAPVAANTMVPLSVSLPLVAAAAGMAGAAEIANAVPATSSAHDIARFTNLSRGRPPPSGGDHLVQARAQCR